MRGVIYLLILVILASLAQAYNPPIYLVNNETRECKYYFAGDERHFNPPPENFTISLGPVTEFSNQDEACLMWQCETSLGRISGEKGNLTCQCPSGTNYAAHWDNTTGCIFSDGRLVEDKYFVQPTTTTITFATTSTVATTTIDVASTQTDSSKEKLDKMTGRVVLEIENPNWIQKFLIKLIKLFG